ncbi:MAG TPA: hypothetical protein VED20_17910 [Streptosporangiaceae bacterium]|nr:hypothetical protein [Streptosporangiaceae bacterium]
MTATAGSYGTGPGVITPDGCAVDFYALMPAFGEPAIRRHVADDGCVIVQQHSPEWFSVAGETEEIRDGVSYRLRDVSRPAANLLTATVEYVVGDRCWTQTFTTTRLDHDELAAALAEAGLRLDRYLTEDRNWFRAVPANAPES